MRKFLSGITIVSTLFSCGFGGSQKRAVLNNDTDSDVAVVQAGESLTNGNPVRFYNDSVLVMPFEIKVNLSPKAKEKITKGNETIIVDVSFSGTPKDSVHAKLEEDGSFYIASAKQEIHYGQAAKFDSIKFSKQIYDQLADKDFDVDVNVYSGRKSSEDNLLNCEPLFDKISNVVNKKFTLKGKLIYGDE